jgi:type IV secretion system protein VirB10
VGDSLRGSTTIPPVLMKNQGERVSVLLSRDLDFSDVYGLERR